MNLCFDHPAIPGLIVLEALGRNEEAVSDPITGPEIGTILTNGLIKR